MLITGTVISIKNGITIHGFVRNTDYRLFRRIRIKVKAISRSLKRILTKLSESRLTIPIYAGQNAMRLLYRGFYKRTHFKERYTPTEKRQPPYQPYYRHSELYQGTGNQRL